MQSKIMKLLVFSACGLTLFGGAYGTYHFIFKAETSRFTPDTYDSSLASEPMSAVKKGSLLSQSPYDSRTTEKAEKRVRARSPAFQREATLDEKKIDQIRNLVRAHKLAREDDAMKRFIPDETGTGFLVRTLLVLQQSADYKSKEIPETTRFIRDYLFENPGQAVASLDQALAAFPKDMQVEKTVVMQQIAHLGTMKSEVRDQVKTSLLSELNRTGINSQGVMALSMLLQVQTDEEWYNEVKESFEKAHPGEDLSELVALHRPATESK